MNKNTSRIGGENADRSGGSSEGRGSLEMDTYIYIYMYIYIYRCIHMYIYISLYTYIMNLYYGMYVGLYIYYITNHDSFLHIKQCPA